MKLIEYLIRPSAFTFSRVLAIKPAVNFVAGLSSPIPSINELTLHLLNKATLSKSDSDIVAGQPSIVAALVRLWLCSVVISVAEMCQRTLVSLLTVGRESMSNRSPVDENLMWRRLFRDRDLYGSIFALCSLQTLGQDGQLGKNSKNNAQARLLNFLVLIDSEPVRHSQFPDIERIYGVSDGGMLKFATMHMIDVTNDILMHIVLISFFIDFLRSPSPMSDSSKALDFLVETGLHSRTVSYYVDPGQSDLPTQTMLYGYSARYISAYADFYPSHLLGDSSLLKSILDRLSTRLDGVSTTSLADSLLFDLKVLKSLPRAALHTRPELELILEALEVREDNQANPHRATIEEHQVLAMERE